MEAHSFNSSYLHLRTGEMAGELGMCGDVTGDIGIGRRGRATARGVRSSVGGRTMGVTGVWELAGVLGEMAGEVRGLAGVVAAGVGGVRDRWPCVLLGAVGVGRRASKTTGVLLRPALLQRLTNVGEHDHFTERAEW